MHQCRTALPSPRHLPHRPDWSRCADYYNDSGSDGADKWRTMAEDKSSDYLVDVLLAQIAGVDVSEIRKDDNFQAMVGMAKPTCVAVAALSAQQC